MKPTAESKMPPTRKAGGRFDSWVIGDRYTLTRVLGKGSYGEVAEAIDSRTTRKVAVKRMQSIFDEITDAKRVYREMHILR